jgi:hypothetical protein
MTTILAMIVDAQHPGTNHYSSRILKNARGSEKGIAMHNYVTSKRMNY